MTTSSRAMKRNRQMKSVAKSVMQKWTRATIHSVDGNRANIRLGASPTTIKNVEISGDGSYLVPGEEVAITWKDNRPVVLPNTISPMLAVPASEAQPPLVFHSERDLAARVYNQMWALPVVDGFVSNQTTSSSYNTFIGQVRVRNALKVSDVIWDLRPGTYDLQWLYEDNVNSLVETLVSSLVVAATGPTLFRLPRPLLMVPGAAYYLAAKRSASTTWVNKSGSGASCADFLIASSRLVGASTYDYSIPIQLVYQKMKMQLSDF